MLATHCGYFATAKNPASNYFLTSSLILRDMSGLILLIFYFTYEHSDLRGSLCTRMLMSIPDISLHDQTNTFTYSRKSSTNLFLISSFKEAPTLTSFLFSSLSIL